MTQGSTLPQPSPCAVVDLLKHKQRDLFHQVKEKASLCRAIQKIAEGCQNEGHVTLDDCETIQYLAHQLGTKLDALAVEIASNN